MEETKDTTIREMEDPCEVTGKACVWESEDEYDQDGNLVAWDCYCRECYRWRCWGKDEYEPVP